MNAPFLSADKTALCSPDRVRNEMQGILRYAQTKLTDEQLSEACGVSPRCIKSYRVEGREPTLGNALSILCALGRTDLNRILALIGYKAVPMDESDKRHCGEVIACILQHSTTIASAAADGRIDHTEEPAVRFAADSVMEVLLPYSSVGSAA